MTLFVDSGVFSSLVVREAQLIFQALEQYGLPGGEHDKSRVVRHRHIDDPGIHQEPPCLCQDRAPVRASPLGSSRGGGAPALHAAGKESSVSSTIRKTVGKSGMNTRRHASNAV